MVSVSESKTTSVFRELAAKKHAAQTSLMLTKDSSPETDFHERIPADVSSCVCNIAVSGKGQICLVSESSCGAFLSKGVVILVKGGDCKPKPETTLRDSVSVVSASESKSSPAFRELAAKPSSSNITHADERFLPRNRLPRRIPADVSSCVCNIAVSGKGQICLVSESSCGAFLSKGVVILVKHNNKIISIRDLFHAGESICVKESL